MSQGKAKEAQDRSNSAGRRIGEYEWQRICVNLIVVVAATTFTRASGARGGDKRHAEASKNAKDSKLEKLKSDSLKSRGLRGVTQRALKVSRSTPLQSCATTNRTNVLQTTPDALAFLVLVLFFLPRTYLESLPHNPQSQLGVGHFYPSTTVYPAPDM